MAETRQSICPECGRAYKGAEILGQCPACLMAAALPPEREKKTGRPRYLSPTKGDLENAFPEVEVVECLGKRWNGGRLQSPPSHGRSPGSPQDTAHRSHR